jgi:hypothetical protein
VGQPEQGGAEDDRDLGVGRIGHNRRLGRHGHRLGVPAEPVQGDRQVVPVRQVAGVGDELRPAVLHPPLVELGRVPEEFAGDEFERARIPPPAAGRAAGYESRPGCGQRDGDLSLS